MLLNENPIFFLQDLSFSSLWYGRARIEIFDRSWIFWPHIFLCLSFRKTVLWCDQFYLFKKKLTSKSLWKKCHFSKWITCKWINPKWVTLKTCHFEKMRKSINAKMGHLGKWLPLEMSKSEKKVGQFRTELFSKWSVVK